MIQHEQYVKNCPFCGFEIDLGDRDMLVPTSFWTRNANGKKVYLGQGPRAREDAAAHPNDLQRVWEIRCAEPNGGCGATIAGDSIDEAVAAWNRRSP